MTKFKVGDKVKSTNTGFSFDPIEGIIKEITKGCYRLLITKTHELLYKNSKILWVYYGEDLTLIKPTIIDKWEGLI